METALDHRIARVVAKRRQEITEAKLGEDHQARERRLTRDKVVSELPRLLIKVSSAVAELNDRLSEADMWIKVEVGARTPLSEAVYRLSLAHPEDDGPILELTIDYAGNFRSFLCTHEKKSFLESSSVFGVDRVGLTRILVSLLEAHYP